MALGIQRWIKSVDLVERRVCTGITSPELRYLYVHLSFNFKSTHTCISFGGSHCWVAICYFLFHGDGCLMIIAWTTPTSQFCTWDLEMLIYILWKRVHYYLKCSVGQISLLTHLIRNQMLPRFTSLHLNTSHHKIIFCPMFFGLSFSICCNAIILSELLPGFSGNFLRVPNGG